MLVVHTFHSIGMTMQKAAIISHIYSWHSLISALKLSCYHSHPHPTSFVQGKILAIIHILLHYSTTDTKTERFETKDLNTVSISHQQVGKSKCKAVIS